MWFWCNLAARQRRSYCAFVSSHSPVGLVSRQWDEVDQSCVLCDCSQWPGEQISFITTLHLPVLQLSCTLFLAKYHITWTVRPPATSGFTQSQNRDWSEEICECDGHTVHRVSQQRVAAEWLPHGRVTVHRCAVRSFLTDCPVTSRPCERFLRYSKWTDTFWTALV
jgi:hypothetical protein